MIYAPGSRDCINTRVDVPASPNHTDELLVENPQGQGRSNVEQRRDDSARSKAAKKHISRKKTRQSDAGDNRKSSMSGIQVSSDDKEFGGRTVGLGLLERLDRGRATRRARRVEHVKADKEGENGENRDDLRILVTHTIEVVYESDDDPAGQDSKPSWLFAEPPSD